ncbi:hypothetical protein C8F04DRAFT_1252411 [Mycena alexandri]|uniref:CxC2-like cysteine cluster KDZ transposase-associated domain-containing protein n=1 Tax=Mycena alexandri TaxID=1745969 RepID=A0AAD6T8R3_9AGAR|nr:hypothetical protein C8F04DRAFT_1252411 [Mycena alexandri]
MPATRTVHACIPRQPFSSLSRPTADENFAASVLLSLRSRLTEAGRRITLRDRSHLQTHHHRHTHPSRPSNDLDDANKENIDPHSVPGVVEDRKTKPQPRTLLQIAEESDSEAESEDDEAPSGDHRQCDFCGVSNTDALPTARRFFFCMDCDCCTHCETCSYDLHIVSPTHKLQEWNPASASWGSAGAFNATVGAPMPVNTLFCGECNDGVLCRECCLEDHATEPLHWLQHWTGSEWEATTLRDIGFVYQMGHGGRACAQPQGLSSPLTVMSWRGPNFLRVRYCDCGKFGHLNGPLGKLARWEQIIHNGWYASTLEQDDVCSTFQVYGAAQLSSQ